MYGPNNNTHSLFGYTTSPDCAANFPLLDVTANGYLDGATEAVAPPLKLEVGYMSSGCSSYGSGSSGTNGCYSGLTPKQSLMQRSVSTQSLHKNNSNGVRQVLPAADLLDWETSQVRRVFSAGDLQGFNVGQHYHRSEESPLSPLSSEISIIEGMSKASPYSPEEKKERIERYRSKRNQRNFNKKIKYECRKTLADSRPRIRGRFAKNDEIEKSSQNQLSHMGIEEDDEDDSNWINFLDSFSASLIP
ncbi:hypothetical protein ACSBR2_032902 [Camellia fascicularis]